jgi:hypothetical protein
MQTENIVESAQKQRVVDITAIERRKARIRQPRRDWSYCTWLGSDRLYSISRIIRDLGLKPDFGAADPAVVLRAAHRGKLVEDYCYRLIQGQSVTVRAKHCGSLQADVAERVEAFWRWMDRYKPVYVDHQSMVWNEQDRICWTRDLRVLIKGELYLVDIKCTSQPAKDWPLQLGCGLSYDEDGCNRAAILQLKPKMNKDGFKFRDEWRPDTLKAWWRVAVERWHSNYRFNRLKNELGFDTEAFGLETEDEND